MPAFNTSNTMDRPYERYYPRHFYRVWISGAKCRQANATLDMMMVMLWRLDLWFKME